MAIVLHPIRSEITNLKLSRYKMNVVCSLVGFRSPDPTRDRMTKRTMDAL
jgi:hypothetical protein